MLPELELGATDDRPLPVEGPAPTPVKNGAKIEIGRIMYTAVVNEETGEVRLVSEFASDKHSKMRHALTSLQDELDQRKEDLRLTLEDLKKLQSSIIDSEVADAEEAGAAMAKLCIAARLHKQKIREIESSTREVVVAHRQTQLTWILKREHKGEIVSEALNYTCVGGRIHNPSYTPVLMAWDLKHKSPAIKIEKLSETRCVLRRAQGGCSHQCIRFASGVETGILTVELFVRKSGCYGAIGIVMEDFNKFNNGKLGVEKKTWAFSFYPGGHNPSGGFGKRWGSGPELKNTPVKLVINTKTRTASYFVKNTLRGSFTGLPAGSLLFPCIAIGCSTVIDFDSSKCLYTSA